MDEVAENSDELMERYLEGEEISHEEIVTALKKGVTEGHLFPVTCGVATKNLGTNRLLEALVEDVPVAGDARRGQGARRRGRRDRDRAVRGRRPGRLRLQDHRRSLHRPDQHAAGLLGRAALRLAGVQRHPQAPRSGSASSRRRAARRPPTVDELGPGDIGAVAKLRETRAGDVLGGQGRRDLVPAARPAGAGDGVRLRAEVEGRRGEGGDGASPPRGGGPDARRPPRPADRRADHRRADPGPRRGDHRADEAPLRRRDRAPPAAGAVPGDDPQARQGARPLQEADRRPGPVRRLPHRDRAGRVRAPGSSSSTRSRAG